MLTRVSAWMFRFFRRAEFSNPDAMSYELISKLDRARLLCGFPLVINSSYRAGDPKSHGKGYAVDIACESSTERFRLVQALQAVGFRRIGVYKFHVHVDVDPERVQDVLWHGHYESKQKWSPIKEYDHHEAEEDGP